MGPGEGERERERGTEMSDAVVAGFTFPTRCTHTHAENTHMPAYAYIYATANPPASARLNSADGRQGGAGGGGGGGVREGLEEGRETGDQTVPKWNRRGGKRDVTVAVKAAHNLTYCYIV